MTLTGRQIGWKRPRSAFAAGMRLAVSRLSLGRHRTGGRFRGLSYQGRMLGHASTPPIRPQLAFFRSPPERNARRTTFQRLTVTDKLLELSIPIAEEAAIIPAGQ